jgi:signal transduction histidine kinase
LSISKAIVEHHNGTIGYETTPGKGTTFYFDLPVRRQEMLARDQEGCLPASPAV